MKRHRLDAVFKRIPDDRPVLRPAGLISPVSIVLGSAQDVPIAKRVYLGTGLFAIAAIGTLKGVVDLSALRFVATVFIILALHYLLVLLLVSVLFRDHEIYSETKHGKLSDWFSPKS